MRNHPQLLSGATRRKRKAGVAPVCDEDLTIISEFLCPITLELPTDPVIAQDGQLYERAAIEYWFEGQSDGHSTSPMTNQVIGKQLVPGVQARSAIERLINNRVISGETARTWTEKRDELQAIDKDKRPTLAKAHMGDAASMRIIGFCYRDGSNGFKKNEEKAVEWFSKAAAHEDPMSIVSMGIFYINGSGGLPRDPTRGMVELTRAAMLGSEHGAISIANHLANTDTAEQVKLVKDENEATRWYKFSRLCKTKDTIPAYRKKRDEWLTTRGILFDV